MPINEIGETKPVLLVTFPNTVNEHFFFFLKNSAILLSSLGQMFSFIYIKLMTLGTI